MHTGYGQIVELLLENELRHVRISCPADMVPSPGQYMLAGSASSSDPLPVSLYSTESTPQSFITCEQIPDTWTPGTEIILRGPLGHGFTLSPTARKVALVPFDASASRLQSLIPPALRQGAGVVFVSDSGGESLHDDVEVQPISALDEVLAWADYVAFDVLRQNLHEFREKLGKKNRVSVKSEAQVLVYAPVPCGGVADCGVCAVNLRSGWKMACKDGPVFDLREIL